MVVEAPRLDAVLAAEYDEIRARRNAVNPGPRLSNARPPRVTAISLSSGSTPFSLGLLQALHIAGRLDRFDYLSTVSGSGLVGGWWSAWLARDERKQGEIFPPPETFELPRAGFLGAMLAWVPARFLRASMGDDVLLVDLKNSRQGAPYHLINAALDLDSFTLSKRYCGSLRTGYLPTDEYARGRLTLGMAVAVSGARVGVTVRPFRRSRQRLTSGSLFDNSGIYPLIERGCNFVLYSAGSSDPAVTPNDLGGLVRKVRVDFGTEIDLDTGSIRYAEAHAKALRLPPGERTGTLLIVGPDGTSAASVDPGFERSRILGQLAGEALIASGKLDALEHRPGG
jgi:hypothetical protein